MTKDTTQISLLLPNDLLAKIDKIAKVYLQDRQDVIRMILSNHFSLKEAEKKEEKPVKYDYPDLLNGEA